MPWSIADGDYDPTHTWTNANDRVEYERARIARAMLRGILPGLRIEP